MYTIFIIQNVHVYFCGRWEKKIDYCYYRVHIKTRRQLRGQFPMYRLRTIQDRRWTYLEYIFRPHKNRPRNYYYYRSYIIERETYYIIIILRVFVDVKEIVLIDNILSRVKRHRNGFEILLWLDWIVSKCNSIELWVNEFLIIFLIIRVQILQTYSLQTNSSLCVFEEYLV